MVMVVRMWRPHPEKAQVRWRPGTGLPTGRFALSTDTRSREVRRGARQRIWAPVFDSLGDTHSSLVLRILTDPGAFSFIQRLVGSTAVTSCSADLRALAGSEARRRGKSESSVSGLHLSVHQTNRPQSASLPPQLSLVPTILHISDLHRTAGPQLSNDELLPALVSDAIRWRAEGIPRPDLVAVSGDLVPKQARSEGGVC